ncbi:MAG TPA: homoserine kinase, partial [Salinimicrobium sp.]|nr:homoserine kinase [Salinimicrobium sp.]
NIRLTDAISQWGNVAGLISGLFMNDMELLGRSMKDVIFEPVRSILIPGFEEMRIIAMENDAIGFGISGSGPSVFALTKSENTANKIAEQQQKLLQKLKINSKIYISPVNATGPKVL